jgi:hypothetical protein
MNLMGRPGFATSCDHRFVSSPVNFMVLTWFAVFALQTKSVRKFSTSRPPEARHRLTAVPVRTDFAA